VKIVQKSDAGPDWKAPNVLLIAPPPLGKLIALSEEYEGGTDRSRWLGKEYA